MKFQYQLMGLLIFLCIIGCTTDHPKGYSEREVQSVFTEYFGISSTVLRPKSALLDVPPPGVNGFPFLLKGNPSIYVVLDRDYWVLAFADGPNSTSYMLAPKDGQSSLLISIGEGYHDLSDADLTEKNKSMTITKQLGIIADEKVIWRQWSDEDHLYSDCRINLPAKKDIEDKKYPVKISVVANTILRRKALEDHLASLQLLFEEPVKNEK
jgi:hypothetical protein